MKLCSFENALRQKQLLGVGSMYAAPGMIEKIGQDWDWCWIDAQHGEWCLHTIVDGVRACNLAGIFSMVRVPGQEGGIIGKVLDTACHAIMVPMVDNADQAKAVVRAARFPPLGQRSFGGRRPINLYGRSYAHVEHPQPLVVCQIEGPAALAQADAIARVDGVDALFFGPDDMALARGLRVDQPRPADFFQAEMLAMAQAAQRHGKLAGGIFGTAEAAKQAFAMGFRIVVGGGDVGFLHQTSQRTALAFRSELGASAIREASGPASFY